MNDYIHELFATLPKYPAFSDGIRRAPKREANLSPTDTVLAIENALRYIPKQHHAQMTDEFYHELATTGRIYGYRFRPIGNIVAKPIDEYRGACLAGKALQLMIDNNLDFDIALYPYELTTYGETGQVVQNWMQYLLLKRYLEDLQDEQTLVVSSGHPLGLFKSHANAPRVMLTNGLLVGKYNDNDNFNRAAAIGVSNYGQFTAGGWFYIGSQGIVHGTYSTLLAVARQKLQRNNDEMLAGTLFVSSGLGGMSGAQGKAVELCNGIGIIAEVDASKIELRKRLGWIAEVAQTEQAAFDLAARAKQSGRSTSIAYHGNIVDLLQYALDNQISIDILTDQTSCHVAFDGGYCPQGYRFEQRSQLLATDKDKFIQEVKKTLQKHYQLIEALVQKGTYFFDYGNSLTTTFYDIGITAVCCNGKDDRQGFKYKSFVQEFIGPELFDFGYGPFRWVCLSGRNDDLHKTDQAAMSQIDKDRRYQDFDNYMWIKNAAKNNLVTGSKARILYQDGPTRIKIALKFNEMVRNGEIGPIMIGRDHMDTGGVDAPSRETSNILDGSNITADMSHYVYAGNAAMGMTLISLHNGGGTGIGNSSSNGYGLLLDGSVAVEERLQYAIAFDVAAGVARRAWARNENALSTTAQTQSADLKITLPVLANHDDILSVVKAHLDDKP